MAHFAEIDQNNIVKRVIVASQEVIDSGIVGDPSNWIQTSYNTNGGIHKTGGTPLRKNYAGIGYKYDNIRDAFIPPQPYPSWTVDEDKGTWKAPKEMPADYTTYAYLWDEDILDWKKSESNPK